MTIETVGVDIQDFTDTKPAILFRVGDDLFECIPDLPALLLIDFAALADKAGTAGVDGSAKDMFQQMFRLVLEDESAERFIARMQDKRHPISINQVNKIMPWILEQYGLRPTEPSSRSSDGSVTPAGGPSLTATAPPEVLTLVPSPPAGF